VIGADGKHSLVAKTVRPEQYLQRPSRLAMYYAYWSGLDVDGFETTIRAERRRGWAAIPTHDQLTVIGVGWPLDEFKANRSDVERSFQASIGLVPEFAERVRDARRESKFIGTADLPGYLRKPYGDGWALIGDAGYHKNPITAMGINDAFRDAELVAAALDDAFSGRARFDQAMGRYQSARDAAALPVYELTDEFAMLEPPPAELQQLLGAIVGDQDAMDDFVSVQANTLAAPEFFAPENVGRLMSRTAPVTARA
jgi:2-polyprenyl-6-methoxyphenol hydroxylase-like FAD-dependent oxidoreductase